MAGPIDEETISATNRFYATRDPEHIYPTEFVIRALLGKYPKLKLDQAKYRGSRILDQGYGDGRNMPLLFNLGFDIYGVEISEEINDLALKRLARLGVPAVLKTGRNAAIPFPDGFFHYFLACHACYYVDAGTTFQSNLDEICRVLGTGGTLICSLPMHDGYIMQGAQDQGGGHYRIAQDPYGYRAGTVFRVFASEGEVREALAAQFEDIVVGFCDDDFFGIRQKVWIVVCKKR